MSTPANILTADILVKIPKKFPHVRLWRQNTGAGVGMQQVREAIGHMRVGNISKAIAALGRPMKFGVVGGGDLSGVIGPHDGKPGGRRCEIEVKAGKDQQSDEQRAFMAMCQKMGGLYIVARSLEDVVDALEGKLP